MYDYRKRINSEATRWVDGWIGSRGGREGGDGDVRSNRMYFLSWVMWTAEGPDCGGETIDEGEYKSESRRLKYYKLNNNKATRWLGNDNKAAW